MFRDPPELVQVTSGAEEKPEVSGTDELEQAASARQTNGAEIRRRRRMETSWTMTTCRRPRRRAPRGGGAPHAGSRAIRRLSVRSGEGESAEQGGRASEGPGLAAARRARRVRKSDAKDCSGEQGREGLRAAEEHRVVVALALEHRVRTAGVRRQALTLDARALRTAAGARRHPARAHVPTLRDRSLQRHKQRTEPQGRQPDREPEQREQPRASALLRAAAPGSRARGLHPAAGRVQPSGATLREPRRLD